VQFHANIFGLVRYVHPRPKFTLQVAA
ncbi:uncharacterized protein METZ01_LOCUS86240, partial [marine metagenome]